MSQQQRRLMADRTCPSRQGRQIQREVRSGRVRKSRSRDRLTIIPTPLARASGPTESRVTGRVPALLRPEVQEPILVDSGRQSADDSIDSQDGEYEDNDDQSEEETEVDEVEEEEELEQREENENLSSGWGAQRSIG